MDIKQQVREAETKLRRCESKAKTHNEKERCLKQYKIDVLKIKEEEAPQVQPMLNDTDLLVVNRGGKDYRITAKDIYNYINAYPWRDHEGGIFHVIITDPDDINLGSSVVHIVDLATGMEVDLIGHAGEFIVLTNRDATSAFANSPGNWVFGDLTDTSQVTGMSDLLNSATLFNSDISNWDVSKVTNMTRMLASTAAFNQDLTSWCVTNIKSEPSSFKYNSGMPKDGSKDPKWGTCP